jgi:methylglyoxal synthase
MDNIKNIALVAHDNCKKDLIEWVEFNKSTLLNHKLVCTGTTGRLIKEVVGEDVEISLLKSGPLGGDQQLGALISESEIDIVIFFNDPLTTMSHDVDVKALLRICVLYNVPTACNRSTADFIISSSLFNDNYKQVIKSYDDYLNRFNYKM